MKSRGLHLIREPKCGTVVTASAGTIAPPDMELFHDKVPAQLVELAEKVYEQNPLFLADRYSVTSRAQPPATPITVDEGFLFLHSRLPGAWWGAGVSSPPGDRGRSGAAEIGSTTTRGAGGARVRAYVSNASKTRPRACRRTTHDGSRAPRRWRDASRGVSGYPQGTTQGARHTEGQRLKAESVAEGGRPRDEGQGDLRGASPPTPAPRSPGGDRHRGAGTVATCGIAIGSDTLQSAIANTAIPSEGGGRALLEYTYF